MAGSKAKRILRLVSLGILTVIGIVAIIASNGDGDGNGDGSEPGGDEPSSVHIYVRYDSPADAPHVSDFRIDYHLEIIRAASASGEGSDDPVDFHRIYSGDTDDGEIIFEPAIVTDMRAGRWLIRATTVRWTGGWVGECEQDLEPGRRLTIRFTVGEAGCGTTTFP